MKKNPDIVKDLDVGQQLLRVDDLSQAGGLKNLSETFRRLYYRLYSNSPASRAERLFENLAIILLLKFCVDKAGDRQLLNSFFKGDWSAETLLHALLEAHIPKFSHMPLAFTMPEESIRDAMIEIRYVHCDVLTTLEVGSAYNVIV